MDGPLRRAIAVAVLTAVLAGLAMLYRYVSRFEPTTARSASTLEAVIQAEDAFVMSRLRGRPQWTMRVARIELRRLPESDLTEFHTAECRGVREGRLLENGRVRATFSAETATYERLLRRLDIQGGLRFRSADGEEISAPRCLWTEQDEYARFPMGAKAKLAEGTVEAPTAIYSTRSRVLVCPDGATATIRRQSVRAGMLEWDISARKVRCALGVSAERKSLQLHAETAELDLQARTLHMNRGSVSFRMDSQ